MAARRRHPTKILVTAARGHFHDPHQAPSGSHKCPRGFGMLMGGAGCVLDHLGGSGGPPVTGFGGGVSSQKIAPIDDVKRLHSPSVGVRGRTARTDARGGC